MARKTKAERDESLQGLINRQYQDGLNYLRSRGFLEKWPLYERFRAGDQWPAPTPRTRNLPRPTVNLIKLVEVHKVAAVMSEQINMLYTAEEIDEEPVDEESMTAGDLFSKLSAATWERIKQDELNEEGLEIGGNTGTVIAHYYWDGSASGGDQYPFIGEMEGEILDPINVFFGNPQLRDVQKQPYIIISSRDDVRSVREFARSQGMSAEMAMQITSDKNTRDEGYAGAQVEVNGGDGKVTVLTKYWKETVTIKGEEGGEEQKIRRVFFARVVDGHTIQGKTAMPLSRYPLAVMQWDRRRKSIHGNGDTEALIPNQRAINTLLAMSILSQQNTGWPKMVIKPGAVDKTKITNNPGEIIEDNSPMNAGDGIKFLTPAQQPTNAVNLAEVIMGWTRQVSGADEAATGAAPGADLNATAIMLLQKASAVPIESIKRRFYRWIEDIGRIWEDFFKTMYNTPRQVILKDEDGEEFGAIFTGTEFAGKSLNLRIDVGPSSTYSESLVLSSLNDARDNGFITYEQYIKYVPKTVAPYRDRLLKELQEKSGIVGQIENFVNTMQPQDKEMFQSLDPQAQLAVIVQTLGAQMAPQQPGMVPPQPTAGSPPIDAAVDPMGVMPAPPAPAGTF